MSENLTLLFFSPRISALSEVARNLLATSADCFITMGVTMWKFGLTVAAGIIGSLLSGQAQAVPSCTGVTDTVVSGGSVSAAFLLTAGNCVDAGDKIFGNFAVGGAEPGTGSANFTFPSITGNVTIGFSGSTGPSATGTLSYAVAINPLLSQGFLIDDLEKDFTLNANITGLPASATLTGTTTPLTSPPVTISCTRNVNPSSATCPETAIFAPVSSLTINETITTGANAIVTALTDTISQVPPTSTPEPASLLLIGSALVGLGLIRRRR